LKRQKKALLVLTNRAIKFGSDILSRFDPVPSAQAGLTTLFGMGRGGPRRYSHQKVLNILVISIRKKKLTLERKKIHSMA
jgi:hypothetical protein